MPGYETNDELSDRIKDLSKARQSLIEELQAIMWYDERIDTTKDKDLKYVLNYNKNDEKEHATLLLEWLRRNDPELNERLKSILFSKKDLKKYKD
jgi:hypothetical protein